MTAAEPHPCECSQYLIEGTWGTDCTAVTRGTFAIGHDAKLKSLLISAGVAGQAVHRDERVHDAQAWADNFGFADRVAAGIERGRTRRANEQPAAPVEIRVGRWQYAATIDADGNATYATSAGEQKTAPAGRYTVVEAAG